MFSSAESAIPEGQAGAAVDGEGSLLQSQVQEDGETRRGGRWNVVCRMGWFSPLKELEHRKIGLKSTYLKI